MASTWFPRLLPLGLCFLLVLFHGCSAQLGPRQLQHHSRLSGRSQCQIDRITAREPNRRVESEAGVSEYWIPEQDDELDCAGVEAVRHTINQKGLLLPYYASAPEVVYVVRGEGIQGTVLPGCPETFETTLSSSEGGKGEIFDRYQKVYRYREGDILALPAGAVHWTYNDGYTPIIVIVLRDTSNVANQLDRNFRKFFLAGNPLNQQGQQGGYGRREGSRSWDEPRGSRGQGRHGSQQEQEGSNIFSGFDDEILQQVFNVDANLARQLKGENDNRGFIVQADNFHVPTPDEQEQQNGIEQTLCSVALRANIAAASRADVYNPRGGRISNLNGYKLPILNLLQLSAERGVLYKNALLAPRYHLNAHSIVYITSGSSRIQIVGNDGSSVFDDVVREGQLIVVPQQFAVVKKAGEEGCEWVAFKTHENAAAAQLAGRLSVLRSLPEEVVVNSYDVSREQAKNLKYNRQESVLLSPSSGSRSSRERGVKALLNVLLS